MIKLDKKSYDKWLKYINYCIKSYSEVDVDDLISAGNYGLAMALKNYNPDKGKLNSYIKKAIHFSIIRAVKNQRYPLQGHQWTYIDNLLKEDTEDIAILSKELQTVNEDDTSNNDLIYNKVKEYYINKVLNERECRILIYKLSGISFDDIAHKYNLTYLTIRNNYKEIKEKVKQYEYRKRINAND